jgi:phenylalanyl-tRNA synthetase alpha chain
MRSSHFPFTEPSIEVDVLCDRSDKGQIIIGEGSDWIEILGCGLIHPVVLENCGIDASQYQGFAMGVGIERLAMLKHGIPDLRQFYEGDARWLRHYGVEQL